MTYEEILIKVSKTTGLPKELVRKIYKAYWYSIRSMIKELPLREVDSNTISQIRTNFNIPSLGKLNCTPDRISKVNNKFDLIKKLKNAEYKED